MIWAIRQGWRYEAVEVVKETAKSVFYTDNSWRVGRETRADKGSFLDWRGTEAFARLAVERLTSATAERDRRINAAQAWFESRAAEILAQADRNPKGEDRKDGLRAEHESAVAKPCAQGEA